MVNRGNTVLLTLLALFSSFHSGHQVLQSIHVSFNTPSNCFNNSGVESILDTVLRIFTANELSHCATCPMRADCCTVVFARLIRCFSYACKAEATVCSVVRHMAKATASSIAWHAP